MRGDGLLYQPSRTNTRVVPPSLRFVDVNPEYGQNNFELLTSEQISIRMQMKNVLSTPYGSEEHEPYYGASLPFLLLEPINERTAFLVESYSIFALSRWMIQRIVLSQGLVRAHVLTEEDGYGIEIPYASIATGSVDIYKLEILR